MSDILSPVLPFHLIQGIRLAHALMESRFEICIPESHADKFTILEELFGINYKTGTKEAIKIDAIQVSHSEPITSVGSIARPLIFPHAILSHCQSLWKPDRDIKISFAGLVTDKRAELISQWCRINIKEYSNNLPNQNPMLHKLSNALRQKLSLSPKSFSSQIGELNLWSSIRGRTFPIKSWDKEYFDLLARSRFVLCPSGDYVWSYRFFETILCGAIPVVEQSCEAYDGFIFKMMSDPIEDLKWSTDIVRHNYDLCIERISIPTDELNDELSLLL